MDLTPRRIMAGLSWRARDMYGRLPHATRVWIDNQRIRLRARRGRSYFSDHERLTRAYEDAWKLLLERQPASELGDFLEFGVFYGSSLACMHEALGRVGLDQVRLFGFDSFEGLPGSASEEDDAVWVPGQFRSSLGMTRRYLRKKGVPEDRVTLIKGWFSDTLTPETRERHRIRRASVLMVDCDLYSSSVESLAFAGPLFGEHTVVFFDDWNSSGLAERRLGERKAFEEFLAANPGFIAEELPALNYKAKPVVKVFLLSRTRPAA